MAHGPPSSAVRALQLELKKMAQEPVEGFRVRLPHEDNIFEWEVAIFGPPGTLYEGGYFKVKQWYYMINHVHSFHVTSYKLPYSS